LREIVENGKLFKKEKDRYEREKTEWFYLKTNILLDNKKTEVLTDIRRDCNGALYYDHSIIK
jgi:hypothetical protein